MPICARPAASACLKALRGSSIALMDLRLRDRRGALQEVKIAALVGLLHMPSEDRTIAARKLALGLAPGALALGELGGIDLEVELAPLHVELDQVAAPDQRERPADEGLGATCSTQVP